MRIKLIVGILAILVVIIIAIAVSRPREDLAQNPSESTSAQPTPALTLDQLKAQNPGRKGNDADQQRFFELVRQNARIGTLNITDCKSDPVVLSVTYGGTFTAYNQESSTRSIYVDDKHIYQVPGFGRATVKVSFGDKGGGIYGYGCNKSSSTNVGYFFVEGIQE